MAKLKLLSNGGYEELTELLGTEVEGYDQGNGYLVKQADVPNAHAQHGFDYIFYYTEVEVLDG